MCVWVPTFPRKKGPALLKSDMLVVNKIELAPHVEVDLDKMRADTKAGRGELPFHFRLHAPRYGRLPNLLPS